MKNSQTFTKKCEYALQANSISQAAYIMQASLRKLIFLTMARVDPKKEKMCITLTAAEACKALGIDGGAQRQSLRDAFATVQSQVIQIENESGGWKQHNWFFDSEYIPESDELKIQIHPNLRCYVVDLQNKFAVFAISDIGKLQGKYSLRIFELAMSYSGYSGKQGNKKNEWWFQYSIEELRHLFMLQNEYKRTGDFRTNAIDRPIKEINKADIGISIEVEYIREGRKLAGIKFNCRKTTKESLRDVNPTPVIEEDKDEILIKKHKELFENLLKEESKNQDELPFSIGSESLRDLAARGRAIKRLKEKLKK